MILKYLPYLYAIFMFLGAFGHLYKPRMYDPMIPTFINKRFANISATIAEFIVGILLVFNLTRSWGGLTFSFLMLAFLPLHLWDMIRTDPVLKKRWITIVRVVIQIVFIYTGYLIYLR